MNNGWGQQFRIHTQALSAGVLLFSCPSILSVIPAHRAAAPPCQQQSLHNCPPTGRKHTQPLMVGQECLLEPFWSHLLPLLLLFLFSSLFYSEDAWCFFHFSNPSSLHLSSLRESPGGLVHILSSYCVSSFSLWHRTIPPEYPAFSEGAGENAWLTPFYSVYSRFPNKALELRADKKSFI